MDFEADRPMRVDIFDIFVKPRTGPLKQQLSKPKHSQKRFFIFFSEIIPVHKKNTKKRKKQYLDNDITKISKISSGSSRPVSTFRKVISKRF
jgi:hypothetical protein